MCCELFLIMRGQIFIMIHYIYTSKLPRKSFPIKVYPQNDRTTTSVVHNYNKYLLGCLDFLSRVFCELLMETYSSTFRYSYSFAILILRCRVNKHSVHKTTILSRSLTSQHVLVAVSVITPNKPDTDAKWESALTGN